MRIAGACIVRFIARALAAPCNVPRSGRFGCRRWTEQGERRMKLATSKKDRRDGGAAIVDRNLQRAVAVA